jgi:hypothetical protein
VGGFLLCLTCGAALARAARGVGVGSRRAGRAGGGYVRRGSSSGGVGVVVGVAAQIVIDVTPFRKVARCYTHTTKDARCVKTAMMGPVSRLLPLPPHRPQNDPSLLSPFRGLVLSPPIPLAPFIPPPPLSPMPASASPRPRLKAPLFSSPPLLPPSAPPLSSLPAGLT